LTLLYRGELEVQAKRKALAILQDEITKILNSSRDLSTLTNSLIKGDEMNAQKCLERMTKTEEEVENLCRNITRDVAEIGSLMTNREDILRTAYIIDDIAGFISGVAFRLANVKPATLKKASFDDDLNQLVSMVVDTIFKLNEMGRALSINPPNAIDIAQDVQTLERQVDAKHRAVILKALNEISNTKDLLLLKDAIEGIEGMVDKCQEAADSFTILALSM
jgi:predicted phosphate transport protein (TIGR00153 family)